MLVPSATNATQASPLSINAPAVTFKQAAAATTAIAAVFAATAAGLKYADTISGLIFPAPAPQGLISWAASSVWSVIKSPFSLLAYVYNTAVDTGSSGIGTSGALLLGGLYLAKGKIEETFAHPKAKKLDTNEKLTEAVEKLNQTLSGLGQRQGVSISSSSRDPRSSSRTYAEDSDL